MELKKYHKRKHTIAFYPFVDPSAVSGVRRRCSVVGCCSTLELVVTFSLSIKETDTAAFDVKSLAAVD